MSFVVLSAACVSFLGLSLLFWLSSCCARTQAQQKLCVVGALCFVYYATSISMSMIQKFLLTSFADGEFRFPLTMTCIHMAIKVLMTACFLGFPCCKRGSSCLGNISRQDAIAFIIPIGVATAGDIAFSNVALLTVTITMYTIGKTSSILFNYSLSAILGLQPARWSLTFVVIGIFSGMSLASYHATDFHFLGFLAVVFAAFLAGTRWVLTERLFEKNERRLGSMELLYVIAPISIPVLLPFALLLEAKPIAASPVWNDSSEYVVGVGAVLFAGVTSFLLILLELAIVNRTSALTTDVLGYVKNITLVVLAGVTYGDALSTLNTIGVCMAFSGAFLYSFIKSRQPSNKPQRPGRQVAYEILSALEMAEAWSQDEDEDPGSRSRSGSLGLSKADLEPTLSDFQPVEDTENPSDRSKSGRRRSLARLQPDMTGLPLGNSD